MRGKIAEGEDRERAGFCGKVLLTIFVSFFFSSHPTPILLA